MAATGCHLWSVVCTGVLDTGVLDTGVLDTGANISGGDISGVVIRGDGIPGDGAVPAGVRTLEVRLGLCLGIAVYIGAVRAGVGHDLGLRLDVDFHVDVSAGLALDTDVIGECRLQGLNNGTLTEVPHSKASTMHDELRSHGSRREE